MVHIPGVKAGACIRIHREIKRSSALFVNILRKFQHKWAKNERAGGAGAPPEAVLGRQDFLPQVRGHHPHRLR